MDLTDLSALMGEDVAGEAWAADIWVVAEPAEASAGLVAEARRLAAPRPPEGLLRAPVPRRGRAQRAGRRPCRSAAAGRAPSWSPS